MQNGKAETEEYQEAVCELEAAVSLESAERKMSLSDRRFCHVSGGQWEGDFQAAFENKTKIEVNKINLSVTRIYNQWVSNRIDVNFVTTDGSKDTKLVEVCNGLYRADAEASEASEAYDNCFMEGISGGIGAFRLIAVLDDGGDDDCQYQRIKFEPIYDADQCVYFDVAARRHDKSDAKKCFVVMSMTSEALREEYGEDADAWHGSTTSTGFDWTTRSDGKVVEAKVVEFYSKITVRENLTIYKMLNGEEVSYTDEQLEDKDLLAHISASGSKRIRTKTIKTCKIIKRILGGGGFIGDREQIAGGNIPIIPYYARRVVIEGIERISGHVRPAKDAQIVKNVQVSKIAEIASLSSYEKPVFFPEQVEGHADKWADDNVNNYPFMLINPILDNANNKTLAGAMDTKKPPNIPPALAALVQIAEADIQDILGNAQAGEQLRSNTSGKAVELVQKSLDGQSFIYVSNMGRAIKRAGDVWISMAKDLYVETGRKMKTIDAQKQVGLVNIGDREISEDGETIISGDLARANFDVKVDIGPSSSSKRDATVQAIIGMMQMVSDQETLQILGQLAIINMEGEGINDVQEYYRKKMVSMGVFKPTDEDVSAAQQASQNETPDPQNEYLAAEALKSEAQAGKAQADTIKALMDAGKSKAQTQEILTDTAIKQGGPAIQAPS